MIPDVLTLPDFYTVADVRSIILYICSLGKILSFYFVFILCLSVRLFLCLLVYCVYELHNNNNVTTFTSINCHIPLILRAVTSLLVLKYKSQTIATRTTAHPDSFPTVVHRSTLILLFHKLHRVFLYVQVFTINATYTSLLWNFLFIINIKTIMTNIIIIILL